MTDEEARLVLGNDHVVPWIDWDQREKRPCWACGIITLDGTFTVEQLKAILHFSATDEN